MKKILIFTLLLSGNTSTLSQEKALPVKNDFVDFNNIKSVLKKDGLAKTVKKKQIKHKKKVKIKKNKTKQFYNLPHNDVFWKMMTEYWLVKNSVILKWDFHKPDYGLGDYFEQFLKNMGEYGVKYKILYINSSNITHFGFPFGKDEYLFVISVPFIKIMDLSKLQISILLYEDLTRLKFNQFKSKFDPVLLGKLKEGNFYQKKFPAAEIKTFQEKVDKVVFESGFNFQEQYQVTKHLNNVFKSNKKFWQNYYSLLEKIDDLTKQNLMYKNYVKIYPSPELQLNWINPIKK
ncbi:MAG: hypothetical protein BM556_07220 [Bacteriovorax sp. MedPE-SWde]|nr:MAG: hypothetical protein BM556_07220 [Bacteriovorax sp. MedPE-SWde]